MPEACGRAGSDALPRRRRRWEKLAAGMAVPRGSLACCACGGVLYALGGARTTFSWGRVG